MLSPRPLGLGCPKGGPSYGREGQERRDQSCAQPLNLASHPELLSSHRAPKPALPPGADN